MLTFSAPDTQSVRGTSRGDECSTEFCTKEYREIVWLEKDYALNVSLRSLTSVADRVYDLTCRTDFERPGFCVVSLGPSAESSEFRQAMVDLKDAMHGIHHARSGRRLSYLSTARFDQQTTTKPHLDSGPAECFLMLGYEPSQVESSLELSDYTKCAFELGLTPEQFMSSHNPMFQAGQELLQPYTTRVENFANTDFQIVCINNSSAKVSPDASTWQGVLHQATILAPDDRQRRVINSTMIASVEPGTEEPVSESEIQEFLVTTVVRRRGYANLHLQDDT